MRASSERASAVSSSLATIFPSEGIFDCYENYLPRRNVSLFAGCVKPPHVLQCINSMQMHRIGAAVPAAICVTSRASILQARWALSHRSAGLACQENNLHASIALPSEIGSVFETRKRARGTAPPHRKIRKRE